tara:strand:+ start:26 stop:397 length:372 start_codon:yes stop_codon:yes gene_type:complete
MVSVEFYSKPNYILVESEGEIFTAKDMISHAFKVITYCLENKHKIALLSEMKLKVVLSNNELYLLMTEILANHPGSIDIAFVAVRNSAGGDTQDIFSEISDKINLNHTVFPTLKEAEEFISTL